MLMAVALFPVHLFAAAKINIKADSVNREAKTREVLTSQQLFMVELSPIKGKKTKAKEVNFKAELRDAFMIICYNNDKSVKEQEWTMCFDGKCPDAKTYNSGTPEYKALDTLIARVKKREQGYQQKLQLLKDKGKTFKQ